MQKSSLILALALAFSPAVWAENVNINGTGVSLEANKTPVNTAKTATPSRNCRKIIASPCRANSPWRLPRLTHRR